jgi:uncharacterized protein (TIGR03435 family)
VISTESSRLPAFDVAAVRHNTSAANQAFFDRTPGRFSATNAPLQTLIQMAYGIDSNLARFVVMGGTTSRAICTANCASKEEILTARFDITAAAPPGAQPNEEQVMLMLRRLLAERFNLRVRSEKRDLPVYALTVARAGRLGPQLVPSEHNCTAWQRARREAARGSDVAQPSDARGRPLCLQSTDFSRSQSGVITRRYAGDTSTLVSQIRGDVDRPLIDRTGLKGNYEWEISSELPGLRNLVPTAEPKAPSMDIALQEQLGLRLVPQTAPFEILVIESVQMPTPN